MLRSTSFERLPQVSPGHLLRLRDAEKTKHGRRNVLQGAILSQPEAAGVSRTDNQRNRIGRVGSVRPAGCRIDHHLGIAMVGRNDQGSAPATNRFVNTMKASVN